MTKNLHPSHQWEARDVFNPRAATGSAFETKGDVTCPRPQVTDFKTAGLKCL